MVRGLEGVHSALSAKIGMQRPAVVGIGNDLKGDDGFGVVLARRLISSGVPHCFDAGVTPENYTSPIRKTSADLLILLDAADFAGEPGEIALLSREDVSSVGSLSTHASSLTLLMDFLQEDGIESVVLSVQPESVDFGSDMSDRVAKSLGQCLELLGALLT